MSLLDVLEVEEFIGHRWDKLIAGANSYPSFPECGISLEEIRPALAVFFRGLGGEHAVELAAGKTGTSQHRLTFRQKLGMEREKTIKPTLDGQTLILPQIISIFPETSLNRALYYWLAAFFTMQNKETIPQSTDPLLYDLFFLRHSYQVQIQLLNDLPGIQPIWQTLSKNIVSMRPTRALPEQESALERVVCHMLGEACPLDPISLSYLAYIRGNDKIKIESAKPKYRPFLPVPLWGEVLERSIGKGKTGEDEDNASHSKKAAENRKLRAQRRNLDQANRNDGFFLHIYDKILSVADMLNVNRNTEDDEEDEALKAADDLDHITVTEHDKKAATTIKMDLDLPANEVETDRLIGERLVPEWDYRRQIYHQDHCSVKLRDASEEGEDWQPDALSKRRIRRVKRQFEALQAKRVRFNRQPDGDELDIEEIVRAQADFKANGQCSNRLYTTSRTHNRDLAVSILVDVSLSTDSWLENRRVIDVEKEALTILGNGLKACGDEFAIHTFTSRKRNHVRIDRVKGFNESFSEKSLRRISALKPGYYTRIGAAVRTMVQDLSQMPNQQKLLLIMTDGKPNDVDHYEGRYGIEDSRKAVQECRRQGITVFGVTVDHKAQDYFPYIFGRGSYQIIGHVAKLSTALPKIYRQLVRDS